MIKVTGMRPSAYIGSSHPVGVEAMIESLFYGSMLKGEDEGRRFGLIASKRSWSERPSSSARRSSLLVSHVRLSALDINPRSDASR